MGTPHKHAAVIKAWADGATIQHRSKEPWEWQDNARPLWSKDYEYRVKPEPKPDTIIQRLIVLIRAWADDAKIEHRSPSEKWILVPNPSWKESYEYRVKPEPKPDTIIQRLIVLSGPGTVLIPPQSLGSKEKCNIQFIFDGETRKLKSVEMI